MDPSVTVTAVGGSLVMVVEEEPLGKGSAVAADCQGYQYGELVKLMGAPVVRAVVFQAPGREMSS